MEPANFRFGGGPAETTLTLISLIAMLIAIGLILLLPRRRIIVPLLLTIFLIPLGQEVVVGGIHLMVLRILLLTGLARLVFLKFSSNSFSVAGGVTPIDKAFSLWAFFYALTFVLTWMEMPALINRLGFLLDAFGMYFLLRFLVQDGEDVHRVIKLFAVIAGIMAFCMLTERLTGHNVFGFLGGASAPEMRDGRIRAQGVFGHAILAGTFGATLLPLFVGLWGDRKSRSAAVLCVISSTVITFTTGSSTPILAYGAGILALFLWPLRKRMRIIRWGIVGTLVALHLVMKAPVWALIARVDIVGGSSGEHRYQLVNQFINHFSEWWLLGAKDYNTWGWMMFDQCNHFVVMGVSGGLITLVYFLALISRSFGRVGTARKFVEGDRKQEWFMWSLGAALFAHVVAFFGISYWDQTQVAWFALLALIAAATRVALQSPALQVEKGGDLWPGDFWSVDSPDRSPVLEASSYPAATMK